ncbi:MAG TPA: acyl-CoA dehydrogenase family protein [Actinomycetota bacterium]|nr:acyl-CoA dehydrogenase family protein [Actinomycetota bacterium]
MALLNLTEEQKLIVDTVREFVEKEVIPVADEMEHKDEFPEKIVEQMKEMGLFGMMVPEEYGGLGMPLTVYALVIVELARGWMSLSGILNTHSMACYLIKTYGTDEQKQRFLPQMVTGNPRASLLMSEPHAGSDVQAIKTRAVRDGDDYVINGQKMWATNGLRSGICMTITKTADTDPPYKGMSMFIVEKEPGAERSGGVIVGKNIEKMGYKGVETTEVAFDDHRVPAANLLGGEEGQGFIQNMGAIEVGRVNVGARAVGVAQRAFEEAIAYAQERTTFGKPIAQHQAIQFYLAEMATKIEAARLLMLNAAIMKDEGLRTDLEAGMCKLYASEMAMEVVRDAVRVHGGYGYSKEYTVERLYRDAPFFVIGEGTSEIQKLVIAKNLLDRYKVKK